MIVLHQSRRIFIPAFTQFPQLHAKHVNSDFKVVEKIRGHQIKWSKGALSLFRCIIVIIWIPNQMNSSEKGKCIFHNSALLSSLRISMNQVQFIEESMLLSYAQAYLIFALKHRYQSGYSRYRKSGSSCQVPD